MADNSIVKSIQAYLLRKQQEEDARRLKELTVPEQMEVERRQEWNEGNPFERFVSVPPEYMNKKYPSDGLLPNLRKYFNTAPEFKKGNKLDE